jgi:hypothetical protein
VGSKGLVAGRREAARGPVRLGQRVVPVPPRLGDGRAGAAARDRWPRGLRKKNLELRLTEILAIYGAALSTVVFVWNILRSARRVRVKLIYGLEGDGDGIKSGVYVFIQNPSSSIAHISAISMLYPSEESGLLKTIASSIKYRRFSTTYGWVHTSLSSYDVDDSCPGQLSLVRLTRFLFLIKSLRLSLKIQREVSLERLHKISLGMKRAPMYLRYRRNV